MLSTTKFFLLKNLASSSLIATRAASWKNELKIKWIRPEKILCIKPEKSGDLAGYEKPDENLLIGHYENSVELLDADDMVKKMFTLGTSKRKHSVGVYKSEMIDRVKRHDIDYGSMESKIAYMTAEIRQKQDHYEKSPRDGKNRKELKELIDKRKKFLKYLRRWDYKRFEWILEKLEIKYVPSPEHFHWITRKESLRKLTDIHCDKIKQERLDAYRKQLEAQQLGFLEDKIKNLEFVRQEQIDCKIPVTIAVEEINEVKKQYKQLKEKREEEAKASQQKSEKEDYELKL